METSTTRRMHPLTAIAAVSVTLFSLAGIAAITGLIPTGHSQSAQTLSVKPAEEPSSLAATAQPAASATTSTVTAAKSPDQIVVRKAAAKPARPVQKAARPAEEPVRVAQNDPSPRYERAPTYESYERTPRYESAPRYEPAPRAEPVRAICYDCGVIESVREIEKKGEGSGMGAAVGGVAGGVLGHQTGSGRGKDVMTVLGALGGAVAGHQIEKTVKKVKSYEIAIRFEDGSSRLITQDTPPAWRTGDRVRLANGVIVASN